MRAFRFSYISFNTESYTGRLGVVAQAPSPQLICPFVLLPHAVAAAADRCGPLPSVRCLRLSTAEPSTTTGSSLLALPHGIRTLLKLLPNLEDLALGPGCQLPTVGDGGSDAYAALLGAPRLRRLTLPTDCYNDAAICQLRRLTHLELARSGSVTGTMVREMLHFLICRRGSREGLPLPLPDGLRGMGDLTHLTIDGSTLWTAGLTPAGLLACLPPRLEVLQLREHLLCTPSHVGGGGGGGGGGDLAAATRSVPHVLDALLDLRSGTLALGTVPSRDCLASVIQGFGGPSGGRDGGRAPAAATATVAAATTGVRRVQVSELRFHSWDSPASSAFLAVFTATGCELAVCEGVKGL
ncbi:hypothetical protein GPECTOR_5g354 [Gonium pectorale]|uniref:Uncharacterized protein n=1 Tax=Gonium pectorale TaxID=33097 RepID=A0A150GWU1_GONPE|nr:hypothetical protein GPECTOR_5g354 [Gonium pectorale]|eukprot:KXZ54265.1 hypothetical protein GPECTOR_5g354 [Gonium pectorale]